MKEGCAKVLVVSSFIESSLLVILTLCTMTHPDGVTYSQSYFSSYIGCLDKSKKKVQGVILDDKLQAKSENSKMLLLILRSLEYILN